MQLTDAREAGLIKQVEELYLSAFPKEERKSFALIEKNSKNGGGEILAIKNSDGEFAGLAITVCSDDLVLLDYFAVAPHHRQGGIGSRALRALTERYRGKRFLLEIESTRVAATNHEERRRRKAFYLKNGMSNTPFDVNLFGMEMEIMVNACTVKFSEYANLYRRLMGDGCLEHIRLSDAAPANGAK